MLVCSSGGVDNDAGDAREGDGGRRARKVVFERETLAMLHKIASRVRDHPDDAR